MSTMEKIHKETTAFNPKERFFLCPLSHAPNSDSPAERDLEVLADSRPSLRQSQGKPHPGLIKHQMGKEVIILLSVGVPPPGILCALLGPKI